VSAANVTDSAARSATTNAPADRSAAAAVEGLSANINYQYAFQKAVGV